MKLDRALRDILAKTDDDYLAKGCLDRLVGRGYDDDIAAYLNRRLPQLKAPDRSELESYKPKLGWTRLHAAVDLDIAELIEAALRDKIAVDAQSRDRRTALHVAADGKLTGVELLMRAKANPNIKDSLGRLPVQIAAQGDHADIVRLLVSKGSDVPDIFVAATVGANDRLAAMLKAKPGLVKVRNANGFTPLHVAAREGHAAAVRALIDAGADVKAVDMPTERQYSSGWTPLHLATLAQKPATAAVLLNHGADANAADERGKHTPLHFAAWFGNTELVTLLLAHNADPNAKDDQKRTPLELAKENKHPAVVKLLTK